MTKPTGRPRGRPKTEWYSTLMARVPDELVERVKRYAAQKQQSISVVIRDALELLLEEDRYQPFLSYTNTAQEIVSDTNTEPDITYNMNTAMSGILSDTKEAIPCILSDTNTDAPGTPTGTPLDTHSGKVSDTNTDTPPILSDTKGDESEPLPPILSDTKEARTGIATAPAFMSDTNVPAFDTTKYVLGKRCPRGHDYHGTGQSLRRLPKFVCLECDAERARERRQARKRPRI